MWNDRSEAEGMTQVDMSHDPLCSFYCPTAIYLRTAKVLPAMTIGTEWLSYFLADFCARNGGFTILFMCKFVKSVHMSWFLGVKYWIIGIYAFCSSGKVCIKKYKVL